jgi:hypothetical protein
MASFDGATFRERPNSDSYSTWGAASILAIKQRPNDDAVTQVVGVDVQRVTINAECTAAELAALQDKHQESGSLVVDWATDTAYLETISSPIQHGIGNDLFTVALGFIKL